MATAYATTPTKPVFNNGAALTADQIAEGTRWSKGMTGAQVAQRVAELGLTDEQLAQGGFVNGAWEAGAAQSAENIAKGQDWSVGKTGTQAADAGMALGMTQDQFASVYGGTKANSVDAGYGTTGGLLDKYKDYKYDGAKWVAPTSVVTTPNPTGTPTGTTDGGGGDGGTTPVTTPTPSNPGTFATPALEGGTVAQYKAAQTVVDPAHTTSGLMNSLLAEDSEYLKRARALSMDKFNERGLGSSSFAQGAGTAAAIDAALGIAAPDAQIYHQTGLANTAAENQSLSFNAGALNNDALQTKQLTSAEQMQIKQIQSNELMQGRQISASEALAKLQIAGNQTIAGMNIDAQKALQLNTQQYQTLTNGSANSLSIMTTLQSKLAAIQMDPNATSDAKRSAATDAINIAKGAMNLIAHSTGDVAFNSALDFVLSSDSLA